MKSKAEWAINSEAMRAMRARGIIVLIYPTIWSKISRIKKCSKLKLDFNSFFAAKKSALLATSGL